MKTTTDKFQCLSDENVFPSRCYARHLQHFHVSNCNTIVGFLEKFQFYEHRKVHMKLFLYATVELDVSK